LEHCFFYQFVKGLIEYYPEIFDSAGGDTTEHQINFSRKWGNYQSIITLSRDNLMMIDDIVKQPLEKCLLYLAFHSDKIQLENILHRESLKRIG